MKKPAHLPAKAIHRCDECGEELGPHLEALGTHMARHRMNPNIEGAPPTTGEQPMSKRANKDGTPEEQAMYAELEKQAEKDGAIPAREEKHEPIVHSKLTREGRGDTRLEALPARGDSSTGRNTSHIAAEKPDPEMVAAVEARANAFMQERAEMVKPAETKGKDLDIVNTVYKRTVHCKQCGEAVAYGEHCSRDAVLAS